MSLRLSVSLALCSHACTHTKLLREHFRITPPLILSDGLIPVVVVPTRFWDLAYPERSYIVAGGANDSLHCPSVMYNRKIIEGTEVVQVLADLSPPISHLIMYFGVRL